MGEPTPGPWSFDYVEVIGKSRQYEIKGKSRFVAGCGGGTPEDEANARLIAAAWDMLVALIGLQIIAEQNVTDLCAVIQEGGTHTPVDKMELARWQAVGEAIAKATGASNG